MSFKPMRSCEPTDKYPVQFPCYVSRKLDGIRVVKYEGKARTKSLKLLPNRHASAFVEAHVPDRMDCEIIVGPPNLQTTYNTTLSGVMTIAGEPEFTLYAFDIADSEAGYTHERIERLRQACLGIPNIVIVDQILCHNAEQLEQLYEQFLEEGYEGLIARSPNGIYKYGKCTPKEAIQFKVKPHADEDCEILEVHEGRTNQNEAFVNELGGTARSTDAEGMVPNGMLGYFIARDVKTSTVFRLSPGKLKHAERVAILQNPQEYIGRFAKYRSMDYGVKDKPRQNRWYAWRHEADV